MRFEDLTGKKFESWLVLSHAGRRGHHQLWWCQCKCGSVVKVSSDNLRSGRSTKCRSCARFKHGHANDSHGKKASPEYKSWAGMLNRCLNPNADRYKDWGGRGIKVHEPWIESFQMFLDYVGPCPGPGYSIDRFPDNDGNYEPGNVRWATRSQQQRNKRRFKRRKNLQ